MTDLTPRHQLVEMLRGCAAQFRYYEMQHRNKAFGLRDNPNAQQDTLAKAVVNASYAEKIEALLGEEDRHGALVEGQGTLADVADGQQGWVHPKG